MSEQVYPWKRFWCPRSGSINLANGGYLHDPDAEWGKAHNPDLVSSEAIADIPCLVLLGEPGIGKSQELENLKALTEQKICNPKQFLPLDLRSCTNLKEDLFKEERFTDWLGDSYHLYLFLDSLDEGLLSIPTLATGLIDELRKPKYQNHINRLHLRLACRTFVFPAILEGGLKDLWKESNIAIYKLAPLRRVDVIEAAKAEGFSPDDFLKEIGQKDVVPLAIKPVTLKFLFNTYRRHNGQFSPGQRLYEFYRDGCKLLCEEVNESRRAANRTGKLDSDQRLIVAARIAAVTIFAKRLVVWTGVDQGDVPAEYVLLQRLCCGHETVKGRQFEINREAIEEVLDTGLFSSRGLHRMGWAHQTYAEFLAAWYLVHHEVPLKQIRQLVFSSEDSEHKLIPQLHETAAWLASMRPDVLQEIITTDPDVLLQTDVPTDAGVRASVVCNLLTQYEEGKLFDHSRTNYRHYAKLQHPGLAEQLRPYVCDSSKQLDVRDLAIDLVEACQVCELQDDLVSLTRDSSQPIRLRIAGANAISLIADSETKSKLKPIFVEDFPENENDDLKFPVLKAICPDHLTTEELFQALKHLKKDPLTFCYLWIQSELVPSFQPHDLFIALRWLENQELRRYSGYSFFERLKDAIFLKAWEFFDSPEVAESFTKAALASWRAHQKIITHDSKAQKEFTSSILSDRKKRYALIEQTVLAISETEDNLCSLLSFLDERLLLSEDIFWMVERFRNSDCEKAKRIWVQLIEESFDRQNVKQIDEILIATQNDEIFQETFSSYFEPIALDSTLAKTLRSNHLRMQESQDRRQAPPLLDPAPIKRVLQRLEELEAGDLSAWWQLNWAMLLKPDGANHSDEFELDLTKLPGWQDAEDATRYRIIEGAKQYIQLWEETPTTIDRPAMAGCRALMLLLNQEIDFLNTLSVEIWRRWAPVVINAFGDQHTSELYLAVVKSTYQNVPEESIRVLRALIDRENQTSGYLSVLDRFAQCWDRRLELALLEKAKDPSLKPQCLGQLLEKLLEQGSTEARDFAQSLITLPLPLDGNEHERVLIAARALIENSDPSSWTFIWKAIQQDSSFGREVLERFISHRLREIQLNLTEAQLADFYHWLVHEYPYEEDPQHNNGVYRVTLRDEITSFKSQVISQLSNIGTLESCAEVKRLIKEFPQISWLKNCLVEAQVSMRRATWQPLTPEEFLQLIASQDKRLVQSGQHLLEVLIESLERLEQKLQGKTPAARDLWDKVDGTSFKPLDENAVSDYVKRFLDEDLKPRGIIVNREVELRRSYGGNSGERTDIHVDAVLKHPNGDVYDSITVIIEVKGCWHDDLQTAMQTQLLERYLADNPCSYGLYLVGWFGCQQWHSQDSRRKKIPKMTIDEVRRKFEEQAKCLSSSGKVIRAYVLNASLR